MATAAAQLDLTFAPARAPLQYFVGAHRPHWLALSDQPLFVSHRTLRTRRSLPRARAAWALDSGGFSELQLWGEWRTTPAQYVAAVRRYASEIGRLEFASQQDWMCEPKMLARTGLSVEQHQARTIANFLELRDLAPELPWMPVLQGWARGDHARHLEQWEAAGVDLERAPRVGVGSICRRQNALSIEHVLRDITWHAPTLKLHGFGVKVQALRSCAELLASADSMAWSFAARAEHRAANLWQLDAPKTGEQNKLSTALEWYAEKIAPLCERGEPYARAA